MDFDYWLFQQINNLAGQWKVLDNLGIFFASYFQYAVGLALVIFLLLGKSHEEKIKNYWMVGLAFLAAAVARLGFTEILYQIFHRLRPFVLNNVHQLIDHGAANSFPSGHAAFFFALAMAVYLFNKKLGAWFFAGAFLISLARIYAGVHYPTDILGGALVGIFSGWLVVKIARRFIPTPESRGRKSAENDK
ncbi:phosphatase PAP2 family protein [Patescibacteria group bacterium]|nr:phosphatase PAP2 family protein [Patescibacteria group bacterium]